MKTFKFFKRHTEYVQNGLENLWSEELTRILSDEFAREVDNEIMGMLIPTVQTIGNDLVSVQPLSTPAGNLFYMDFKINKFTFKFFRG